MGPQDTPLGNGGFGQSETHTVSIYNGTISQHVRVSLDELSSPVQALIYGIPYHTSCNFPRALRVSTYIGQADHDGPGP